MRSSGTWTSTPINNKRQLINYVYRDSEESAPAEFPPDQPEVDAQDDDGAGYGAEEVELEDALKRELEEAEKEEDTSEVTAQNGEDHEMGGAEDTAGASGDATVNKEDEEASDAESEDLEAESSDSEDDDLDEEDGDEEMDMGDDGATSKPGAAAGGAPEVMVH